MNIRSPRLCLMRSVNPALLYRRDDVTASYTVLSASLRLKFNGTGTLAPSAHILRTNAPAPKGGTGRMLGLGQQVQNPTGSYNIASCTETSAGVYEYTFEVPMPSSVYSTTATSRSNNARVCHTGSETTTGFLVRISDQSGNPVSAAHSVVVHATNASLPSPLTQDDLLFVDGRNASTGNQRFNVINANTSDSL